MHTRGLRPRTPSTPGSLEVGDEQPESMFGISFDGIPRAQEFMLALSRLASLGQLKLRDAAVVVKDGDGKVRVQETIDPQPGRAALSGAMWAGLIGLIIGGPVGWIAGLAVGAGAGAVTAKVVDLGIPDEWIDWFKEAVRVDTATVVALVTDVNLEALVTETKRFAGAELVHTTLAPGVSSRLTAALHSPESGAATW
jgi:uncharacterized membrane protein